MRVGVAVIAVYALALALMLAGGCGAQGISAWTFRGGNKTRNMAAPVADIPARKFFAQAADVRSVGAARYIFGGTGYTNSSTLYPVLNDLYKIDIVAGTPPERLWGTNTTAPSTVFVSTYPVGRTAAQMWVANSMVILYGGVISSSQVRGDVWLYDLAGGGGWKANSTSSSWTASASNVVPGTCDGSLLPGLRGGATYWRHPNLSNSLYVFGGSVGPTTTAADVWYLDVSGSSFAAYSGKWCYQGGVTGNVLTNMNTPNSRSFASVWVDESSATGAVYIFGGIYGATVSLPSITGTNTWNDIWLYDPGNAPYWTYISGCNGTFNCPTNSTLGGYMPGGRWGVLNWIDPTSRGTFFMTFGFATGSAPLNETWSFDKTLHTWTLVSVTNAISPPMGALGVPENYYYSNHRSFGGVFEDITNQRVVLYNGEGADHYGAWGLLSDRVSLAWCTGTECQACAGNGENYCTNCTAGKWALPSSPAACADCHSSCYTCVGAQSNQCTSCDGLYFVGSNGVGACRGCDATCNTCFGALVWNCLTCKPGSYINVTNFGPECKLCNANCATCTGTGSNCTSCGTGKFLVSDLASTSTCKGCNETCTQCTGTGPDQCLACVDSYYLSGTTCYACSATCKTCSSATTCLDCPLNKFLVGGACLGCDDSCGTCSGPATTQCLSCRGGSFFQNGACVKCENPDCSVTEQTQAPSTLLNQSSIVYIGVGVGVGLPLLIALVAIIILCRGRKKAAKDDSNTTEMLTHKSGTRSRDNEMTVGSTMLTQSFKSNKSSKSFAYTIDASAVKIVPWDDLQVISELGSGGFGTVYRVRQKSTYTEMALKVFREMESPEQVEQFVREATVLLSLHHLHCLSCFGIVIKDSEMGILTEFMSGGDLAVRAKKMTFAQKMRAITDAAKGLAYLHANGMTHADIKPSNILVDDHGTAMLGDFGLTGLAAQHGYTERYAAPEVLNGAQPDTRADVYSFGVVILSVINGVAPFNHLPRDARRIDSDVHQSPGTMPLDTDATLVDLVNRCCSSIPTARPTIKQVVETLVAVPLN